MIGMINLSADGPVDFYAAAPSKLQRVGRPTALANLDSLPEISSSSKPPPSPATKEKLQIQASLDLFSQPQRKPSYGYCADGRRCKDGRPINAKNPSNLWDELFMRKMVNKVMTDLMISVGEQDPAKIQDEIASPIDHLSSMEKTFARRGLLNRQMSRSQPSLCTEEKSSAARFCDSCTAVIDEEFGTSEKKERTLSDIFSPRDDLVVETKPRRDSESALDDIFSPREDLTCSVMRERALSDIFSPRTDLIVEKVMDDSEDVLDEIISAMLNQNLTECS